MIVGRRTLKLRSGDTEHDVVVSIHAPEEVDRAWQCDYEIGWPERPRRFHAFGADALQALHHALQMVGIDLYATTAHQEGRLRWDTEGRGYGFPVPATARDMLVGDDKEFF